MRLLAILLLTASGAWLPAAGQRSGLLPDGSHWLLALEVDRLLASPVGVVVEEGLRQRQVEPWRAALQALTNLDPLRDLDRIALYGRGEMQDEAVLVLQGRFDHERLRLIMQVFAGYRLEPAPSGVLELHSWIDAERGGRAWAALLDARTIALGPAREAVLAVQAAAGTLATAVGDDDDPILLVLADDLPAWQMARPEAQVLRELRAARIAARVEAERVRLDVQLVAADPRAAERTEQLARGLVALAGLGEGEMDPLGRALLTNATVTRQLATVRLASAVPAAVVVDHLRRARGDWLGAAP